MYALATLAASMQTHAVHAQNLECIKEIEPAPHGYGFSQVEEPSFDPGTDARVGQIIYTRLPIFDESNPKENNAIFRWANRFHVMTTARTVERDLLFAEGDAYQHRLVDESARLLRDRGHLYDADIRPVSRCGNVVDVEVITRDVWSFAPEVSFDRSGGETSFRFGISEGNLFGTGRDLSFSTSRDSVRTSNRFVYADKNAGGSRLATKLDYSDTDDGFHQFASVQLPFYSLDSRRSWGASFDKLKEDDSQYFKGKEVTSVRHEVEEYIASVGWSAGLVNTSAHRWNLGYVFREDRFSPVTSLPPPTEFPRDMTLSYPFVSFSRAEDAYTKAFNIDQIQRTEDLHTGRDYRILLGYAAKGLGSDKDRLILKGNFRNTPHFDGDNLIQQELTWRGLWNFDTNKSEDVLATYHVRFFRSQTTHRSFFAKVEATWSENLNTNSQVLLGGLSGARAFDNRFQAGDRKVLLSFEERQYTDVHILNLIRLGFAVFMDVGRAWRPGVDDGLEDDLLADIGFGIRLASSKSNVGQIVHIDFAFPLTNRNDPLVNDVQIAINIKDSF